MKKKMTKAEHRKRHQELHRAFDELAADWLEHNCKYGDKEPKMLSNTTIMELMEWSHQQTIDPTTDDHAPEMLN